MVKPPNSYSDIEKIAEEYLKKSKAINIFPTPVDKIVNYADLKIDNSDILINPNENFLEKYSGIFHKNIRSALDKIMGLIDIGEEIIYVDPSISEVKQKFVKLHEVGHNALPWQRKMLAYVDDKKTLSPDVKNEIEIESSYFASAIFFQLDVFEREIKKYPLQINSGIYLAERFGSSIHAALRRYVEKNPKRCALLVLENNDSITREPKIRNYFQSTPFTKEFGELAWKDSMLDELPFVTSYRFNTRRENNKIFTCQNNGASINFEYAYFHNFYNGFVLIRPSGEKIRTKKIIQLKTV